MCGLTAVIDIEDKSISQRLGRRMNAEVSHRGPDGMGEYYEDNIYLGHRRLAILDTSHKSDQPFSNDERYVLIFNGEIFNYIELRDELKRYGATFETGSDTEVLLEAYKVWGEDVQNKLNGMWAFVVWDKHSRTLFASRDRFGIKPLYWSRADKRFFLASEIKQLRVAGFGKTVNDQELSRYLYCAVVNSSDETFFKDIFMLNAGHSMTIREDTGPIIKRWYKWNDAEVQDLDYLIQNSVEMRLRSDVKVGCSLSGGIDSSRVAIEAAELAKLTIGSGLECIHAKCSEDKYDESHHARLVSEASGSILSVISPSPEEFWRDLDSVIISQDEPFCSPSIYMQFYVMQKAKELGVKVMLDGQGADEVFLGYNKYLELSFAGDNAAQMIARYAKMLKHDRTVSGRELASFVIGARFPNARVRWARSRMGFLRLDTEPAKKLYEGIAHASRSHTTVHQNEIYSVSLPALLRYADRNSMASSVEARVPYLDYRVVENAMRLPLKEKIRGGWSKYFLRTNELIPKQIAWRKDKIGFNAPERTWIESYQEAIRSQVFESSIVQKISDMKMLKGSWSSLSLREKWRLFCLARWELLLGVTI